MTSVAFLCWLGSGQDMQSRARQRAHTLSALTSALCEILYAEKVHSFSGFMLAADYRYNVLRLTRKHYVSRSRINVQITRWMTKPTSCSCEKNKKSSSYDCQEYAVVTFGCMHSF